MLEVIYSYEGDEVEKKMEEQLSQGENKLEGWHMDGELLKKDGKLYVGTQGDIRSKLVNEVHGTPLGGHSGILATYHRLQISLKWPGMKKDVYGIVT